MTIEYCSYSSTIRQMPQNYMLAKQVHGVWVVDADGAVSVDTVLHVAMAIHCDGTRFLSGKEVANAINHSMNAYSIEVS